jgi:Zn-dependent protease with chaperone function
VIWLTALSLRAAAVALAAAWLMLFFPGTHLFEALTHWCWHHLASTALSGHDAGHVTTLVPTVLGAASVVSVAIAGVRLTRALRRLRVVSATSGPSGSIIVGGDAIALAVVGVVRPQVLVSAGALVELSDEELDAALTHERAHIARRHRYVALGRRSAERSHASFLAPASARKSWRSTSSATPISGHLRAPSVAGRSRRRFARHPTHNARLRASCWHSVRHAWTSAWLRSSARRERLIGHLRAARSPCSS